MYFLSKSKKSENISSSSTGREKLIDLSNNLQDELLRGITDLSVIHYHSNEYYKPYTLQAQRELENRKRKEHRTENNEAKSSVLVDQGAQNDKNHMRKLLEKNVNFSDYVKLKEQKLFWRAAKFNMDSVFIKRSIFDKPGYLLAADIMSHRQYMNR